MNPFLKKQQKYPFPSRFGSHASMVVKENEDKTVVCKDEFGEYTTFKNRLDTGLADPARCNQNRLGPLYGSKNDE